MSPDTILLVDDEPLILRALARMLRGLPYPILTASSGEQALEILKGTQVALVLSDVNMPGMSGLDLMRRISAEHPSVVRMVLTAGRDFAAAVQAINDGAVSKFLLKPIDNDELRRIVSDALSARGQTLASDPDGQARLDAIASLRRREPAIWSLPDGRDPYVLAVERLESLARQLEDPTLLSLLSGSG